MADNKTTSPLDAPFWGSPGCSICEFSSDGELIADWHRLRECYEVYLANRNNLIGYCKGDSILVGRIMIGAAIWKARNS
jgi:hypothetical protein